MSHQKTKRVQSPLKGKYYSMIRRQQQIQSHTIFSSRMSIFLSISAQKRKPIFNDTPTRQNISSSSQRKKIFTQRQKSKQSSYNEHFSKIKQAQQMIIKNGDFDNKSSSSSEQSDSISSSSIQSSEGLAEVKRRLFPSTPIKKKSQKSQELQNGRDFLSNSWKKLNFDEQEQHPKSTISVSTNNVDKTVLKSNLNTPVKKENLQFMNQKLDSLSHRKFLKFQTPQKQVFIPNSTMFHTQKFTPKQAQKDLAKQLRQLHHSLVQKSQNCSRVDERSQCLRKENQLLRRQNERLKRKFEQFQMKEKKYFSEKCQLHL